MARAAISQSADASVPCAGATGSLRLSHTAPLDRIDRRTCGKNLSMSLDTLPTSNSRVNSSEYRPDRFTCGVIRRSVSTFADLREKLKLDRIACSDATPAVKFVSEWNARGSK